MDLISKAMEMNLHLCKDRYIAEQTWEQFYNQLADKLLFLFGVGGGMEYFFRDCCNHMEISGVIDNDKSKQYQQLGWYSAEAFQTEYENISIQSPDILKDKCMQDVIVLITSIKYYGSMIEQLKKIGVKNYYVLLMMEVNKRKNLSGEEQEGSDDIRNDYIDWCCRLDIKRNKIVMRIGEYGGHAKCITKQLLKLNKDLDIVWLVHSPYEEVPQQVRQVPEMNWKRYTYEMETAKIWLFDANVFEFIRKREKQIYIQVKHWSSITLKKFYLDDQTSCVSPEIAERIRKDGARMDYLFSGSALDEESCRSGLAFRGKAIRLGSARSDILFDKTIREKVYRHFKLDKETHLLLYAPTYRQKEFEENKRMSVTLKMDSILEAIKNKWGGKWILLVRLHPWVDFNRSGLTESTNIVNAGNYPESEELVAAADIMITDYSSIMFEGAFVKKPVFLYAPDKKEYIDGERGFLLDYNTLPFPVAETNEELKRCISNFDKDSYEKKVLSFFRQYDVCEDGHASERAARFIIDLIEEISV